MNNKKITTAAESLDKIFKIAEGFMTAFAIIFAVFAVLVLIFKEKMAEGSFSLDLDFVKIYLSGEYGIGTPLPYIIMVLIIGCFGSIAVRFALKVLRGILKPIKEGRPFAEEVPGSLRKLAFIVLAGGGVTQIIGIFSRMMLTNELPMDVIFSSPAIESVEYIYTMDFGFVWMFCVLLLLSRIFTYGVQLQQESDETL